MFSGGLDSSFILSELLLHTDVHLLYVKGIQGPNKIKKELACREDIKEFIHTFRPDHDIRSDTIIELPYSNHTQAIHWFLGACDHTNGVNPNHHSELIVGYVMGDSICSMIHTVKSCWDNLQDLGGKHKKVPLSTPLVDKFIDKQFILQHKNIPDELLKRIWVCETPVVGEKESGFEDKEWYTGHLTPCGECPACKRIVAEMAILGRPIPAGSNLPDPKNMKHEWCGTTYRDRIISPNSKRT